MSYSVFKGTLWYKFTLCKTCCNNIKVVESYLVCRMDIIYRYIWCYEDIYARFASYIQMYFIKNMLSDLFSYLFIGLFLHYVSQVDLSGWIFNRIFKRVFHVSSSITCIFIFFLFSSFCNLILSWNLEIYFWFWCLFFVKLWFLFSPKYLPKWIKVMFQKEQSFAYIYFPN